MASNPRHDQFLADMAQQRRDALASQNRSVGADEMRVCKRCGCQVGTKSQCLSQGIKQCPRCGCDEAVGVSMLAGETYSFDPQRLRAKMAEGGANAAPNAPQR